MPEEITTIQQLKEETLNLENNIFTLVDTFERRSGLSVKSIELYVDGSRMLFELKN